MNISIIAIDFGGVMKKPEYKRCPRCELNFIKKGEKLCSVCQAELSNKDDYLDDLDLELCPICKTNYIQPDEIMCSTCLKEHQTEDGEVNADWSRYIERDDEDDYVSPDEETGEMASVHDIDDSDILDGGFDGDMDFDDDLDDDLDLDEELDDDLDFDDDDDDEEDDDDDDDYDDDDED